MIKPLGTRVLVKREEERNVTESGIVLPVESDKKSKIAKVIAVGDGKTSEGKEIKLSVKVGDKVLLGEYGGNDITYKDEDYTIIDENEILAIIKEDEK